MDFIIIVIVDYYLGSVQVHMNSQESYEQSLSNKENSKLY